MPRYDPDNLNLTEEEWKDLLDGIPPRSRRPAPQPAQAPTLRSSEELDALFPDQPRNLICPKCKSKLILKDSKYGLFYGCERWRQTSCRGSRNCDKVTGFPEGWPAGEGLEQLRREATDTFDRIWITGRMKRKDAYTWLGKKLAITDDRKNILINDFNEEMCRKTILVSHRELHPVDRFQVMDELEDI